MSPSMIQFMVIQRKLPFLSNCTTLESHRFTHFIENRLSLYVQRTTDPLLLLGFHSQVLHNVEYKARSECVSV